MVSKSDNMEKKRKKEKIITNFRGDLTKIVSIPTSFAAFKLAPMSSKNTASFAGVWSCDDDDDDDDNNNNNNDKNNNNNNNDNDNNNNNNQNNHNHHNRNKF